MEELKTAKKLFRKEFAWVRNRLLKEFPKEDIFVAYYDMKQCFAVAAQFVVNGIRRRKAIKLIDEKGKRFDRTPEHEDYLEKFIENLKND